MIDVDSAIDLLAALRDTAIPSTASEAEEVLLNLVARNVQSLREWPVNQRLYESVETGELLHWTPEVAMRVGTDFGAKFCMVAAHLALRDPRKLLTANPPPGVSLPDFRRAIDHMPRYLAWIAAQGYVATTATWAPAVAAGLSRRLTWWHLTPHPRRGSGRLLWMLERLLEPEHLRTRMPDLWSRARQAGFTTPDRLGSRPRGVDATVETFAETLAQRAVLHLDAPTDLLMPLAQFTDAARLTVMTSTGSRRRAITTIQPAQRAVRLPIPQARNPRELAADVFLYTRGGDYAYQNLTTDIPPKDLTDVIDPVDEAAKLLGALPDLTAVSRPPSGLRRLLMTDRRKQLAVILPLLALTNGSAPSH